jgi:hypothetical protein
VTNRRFISLFSHLALTFHFPEKVDLGSSFVDKRTFWMSPAACGTSEWRKLLRSVFPLDGQPIKPAGKQPSPFLSFFFFFGNSLSRSDAAALSSGAQWRFIQDPIATPTIFFGVTSCDA